jgi:ribosomal protein S10
MKHHLKVEIKAEDTQSLERQLKELVETCNRV